MCALFVLVVHQLMDLHLSRCPWKNALCMTDRTVCDPFAAMNYVASVPRNLSLNSFLPPPFPHVPPHAGPILAPAARPLSLVGSSSLIGRTASRCQPPGLGTAPLHFSSTLLIWRRMLVQTLKEECKQLKVIRVTAVSGVIQVFR